MSTEERQQEYRAYYISVITGQSAFRDEDGRPAKKAKIDSIPVMRITEEEGTECSICLTEYEVNSEAKEMPCKHKFHSDCLNKWLNINRSCPVCRFQLPIEQENNDEDVIVHVEDLMNWLIDNPQNIFQDSVDVVEDDFVMSPIDREFVDFFM